MRGRLAEADMLLAMLVTWTLVAFDRLRGGSGAAAEPGHGGGSGAFDAHAHNLDRWRWGFFTGLGLTALVKGVGFGAALVLAVVVLVLAWDRDRPALRRLWYVPGWVLAGLLGLSWPLLAALRHPSALGLWFLHVSDRLSPRPEHFTGQRPWEFVDRPGVGPARPQRQR
jgi:4-amino-4-deoxy-L-arabinose transferase-like glycosyltransferase